jgi:predicted dehydrogenase
MNKLRCAVIGCGRIGCGFDDISNGIIKTHAGSYYQNNDTKLVSLCDIDSKKLKKYGDKYNVSGLYTKSLEMFQKESIQIVSICTLVETHLDLVKQAAKFNVKAIFLEKPISTSLKDAKKIIEICNKNNILLIVDHQRRFDPFYQKIKLLVKNKKIGKIQKVNVYYGSGVSNTGSHLFDLLRMFFGEIKFLESNFSKNISNNIKDPNVEIKLEFLNKINCTIHGLDYRNYALFEMDIIGTLGRMRLDLVSHKIEYFKIDNKNSLVYHKLKPSNISISRSKYSPIQLAIKNLINSLSSKNNSLCTGLDGYKSLELIIASLSSANINKKISLPILNNNYKIGSK